MNDWMNDEWDLIRLQSITLGLGALSGNEDVERNELIMNCDQLSEIHFGAGSFFYYESLELKDLPSLISIQLDGNAFYRCHLIVFDSMNDWWMMNGFESTSIHHAWIRVTNGMMKQIQLL